MPVRSKAQARYLYAKFGKAWVDEHHFGQETASLPEHVASQVKKAKAKKRHVHK